MKHLGTITLETERLLLRKIDISDSSPLYENCLGDEQVMNYMLRFGCDTVGEVESEIKALIEKYENLDVYDWGIILKESNELIGRILVSDIKDKSRRCDLSLYIGKKFWGKGYASEANRVVALFLLNEVGFNRVEGMHIGANINSGKAMLKSGMKFEGILRERGLDNDGNPADLAMYSIIKKDLLTENKQNSNINRYTFDINDRAFNAIINKTKRIEIRVNTDNNYFDYGILKPEDEIVFINSNKEKILCKITDINWYKDIETLLTMEGTRYTLSSTNDFNEGVRSINSFKGYEEGIKKNGVYAIHIDYLSLI